MKCPPTINQQVRVEGLPEMLKEGIRVSRPPIRGIYISECEHLLSNFPFQKNITTLGVYRISQRLERTGFINGNSCASGFGNQGSATG